MPDPRASGRAGPALASRGFDHAAIIQWCASHRELRSIVLPRASRAVSVHLDTEVVGILQVDRLTHEMVRHSMPLTVLREMRQQTSEGGTIGQQDREVVQAEQSVPRR